MQTETIFGHDHNVAIANATNSGDWELAIQTWVLREAGSATIEETFRLVANAYVNLKRPDDADEALSAGVSQYPQSLKLNVELGWLTVRRRRLDEALLRWEVILNRFSTDAVGTIGYAATLMDQGRFALAEIILTGGKARFPGSLRMATDYARVAQRMGSDAEAAKRWQALTDLFPNHDVGYCGYAGLLRNLGQLDEAVKVVELGLARLPRSRDLRVLHAWLATYKQQWLDAEQRWLYVKNNFEATENVSRQIMLGLGEIKMGRELNSIDEDSRHHPSENISGSKEGPPSKNTCPVDFQKWQSLGDDCEFGLVQRHFGFEPIGLLRWASTKIQQLTNAFSQNFHGVGDLDNTVVEIQHGEYSAYDKHFGLRMHTFIRVSVKPKGDILDVMAKRMRFLRRKLLEDLELGDQIFVYKSQWNPAESEIVALHQAMEHYGRNNLLVVVTAREPYEAGFVRLIRPGLALGYLQEFGNKPNHWDIDFKGWLGLCEIAQKMFEPS